MKRVNVQLELTLVPVEGTYTLGPYEGGKLYTVKLNGSFFGVIENCACWQWTHGPQYVPQAITDGINEALRMPDE